MERPEPTWGCASADPLIPPTLLPLPPLLPPLWSFVFLLGVNRLDLRRFFRDAFGVELGVGSCSGCCWCWLRSSGFCTCAWSLKWAWLRSILAPSEEEEVPLLPTTTEVTAAATAELLLGGGAAGVAKEGSTRLRKDLDSRGSWDKRTKGRKLESFFFTTTGTNVWSLSCVDKEIIHTSKLS